MAVFKTNLRLQSPKSPFNIAKIDNLAIYNIVFAFTIIDLTTKTLLLTIQNAFL